MDNLEDLLYEQSTAVSSITRLLVNVKKIGKKNFTSSVLQARLNNINSTWATCKALDVQIHKACPAAERVTLPYFKDELLVAAEQIYWEANDFLTQAITACSSSSVANGSSSAADGTIQGGTNGFFPPLPKIPLPQFSGAFIDWISYRDLFKSLVINNELISNVQKLYYLLRSVEGEAHSLLKNIGLEDANFEVAWAALEKRYDQSRHIIDSQLTKLFNAPRVYNESFTELKELRDETREAYDALKNLKRPVDTWDDLLAFMTIRKFDPETRREWEMKIGEKSSYPKYLEVHDFLEYRIRALESIAGSFSSKSGKSWPSDKGSTSQAKSHLSTAATCRECGGDHSLYKCDQFRRNPVNKRLKLVRDNNLCTNCLSSTHKSKQCPSKFTCHQCKLKHHTLLHDPDYKKSSKSNTSKLSFASGSASTNNQPVQASTSLATQTVSQDSNASTSANLETLHVSQPCASPASVMLATAWVLVASPKGHTFKIRVLLDQGSQTTFITESTAQLLKAPRTKTRTPVSGIGGSEAGIGRTIVNLIIKSCYGTDTPFHCTALVFQKLTTYVPRRVTSMASWRHLDGLTLADPDPSSSHTIQMILGADVYAHILREGLKRGPAGSPIAQNTSLGWILSGPTTSKQRSVTTTLTAHISASESLLSSELRLFWEIEEIPTCSVLSEEEQACETHFAATHRRLSDGRYCVRLPFKEPIPIEIGASIRTAENWLTRLERKFSRDPKIVGPYCEFMNEYLALGHMLPTTFDAQASPPAVFLPHHPVLKDSSTTSLRVVFNASSRTSNGTSLNDHLMTGPRLQTDLPAIILRWRQYKYAFTADITKMYRQILVDPDDTQYQQILWRSEPTQNIVPYKLLTVTYGTASAPFLAIRVLQQLAKDEQATFPLAASIVKENFYVDDALFGANDECTANALRLELEELLKRGCFTLRKWMASHESLLASIPVSHQEKTKIRSFDSTESIKVLGIGWIPKKDAFCFNTNLIGHTKYTKRSILSVIAKLFDPLGWLSPVLITAKIIIQELWITSTDWDDELPTLLEQRWRDYCSRLPELHTITIPRWNYLESNDSQCQLHGFADASSRAYAAIVYLRVLDGTSKYQISLLAAKSKVAPIKTISIPRLELCAATLLTKLLEFVRKSMKLTSCTTHAWTDSTVVLAWLKQHPSEWPTFVANRVAAIQSQLPDVEWRHVPTAQNPADCASRGFTATELCKHQLWWQGPEWLQSDETCWPRPPKVLATRSDVNEEIAVKTLIANAPQQQWDLCNDVSTWPKLLRVTAYCQRIAAYCRRTNSAKDLTLSGIEIAAAKRFWIKYAQSESFRVEIQALNNQVPISRNSPVRALNPFIDEHNILRVGGRLERSSLSFDEKHPIILPKHRVTTLIVENAHLRCLHGGPQLTISLLRQSYWILGHRPFVRNLIHKCVPCVRERALVPQQIMGNLPTARVSQTRPFLHTGLDYAGPFPVRMNKGRGHQSRKSYLSLFVCLSTRAIHLELVSDYSSESFIAAYRRFVSRRGLPSDVYSDNGTTFQGADKELQKSFKAVIKDPDLRNVLAMDNTTWHFIPPGAPHFGGLWEAGVKSTKYHLRRVLGARTLTFEELITLFTQIEACLNSRPIGPASTDSGEFAALTPGNFLTGAPLLSVPEPSLLDHNETRLSRWQLVQQILGHFWKRWSTEYFHSLQIRTKWIAPHPNVQVGDLVLIRNNNLPPCKWMLGRVIECHPGSDSHVRVATIRTAQSTLRRPITQLCMLPIRADHKETPSTPDSDNSNLSFHDCEIDETSMTPSTPNS